MPVTLHTLLHHRETDQCRAGDNWSMNLEVEFPSDIAGVDPRIIQRDVEHGDGHILHVYAPVPLEPTTEAAPKFLLLIFVLVDL